MKDTHSRTEGARMAALLKKAKIRDTLQANQNAIDSGMYETSEASEDLEELPKHDGLTERWFREAAYINLRREATEDLDQEKYQ